MIYSVPWYFGKECKICESDFSKKLFFDINEHEAKASVCKRLNQDYWSILSKETGDNNWLNKTK